MPGRPNIWTVVVTYINRGRLCPPVKRQKLATMVAPRRKPAGIPVSDTGFLQTGPVDLPLMNDKEELHRSPRSLAQISLTQDRVSRIEPVEPFESCPSIF